MQYKSTVGNPIKVLSPVLSELPYFNFTAKDLRGFYKKGDTLDGFTFEKNDFIITNEQLFTTYGLYQNENGINTQGKEISYYSSLRNVILTSTPIFTGDYFNSNLFVVSAYGVYNTTSKLWEITYISAPSMPEPLKVPDENDFNKQIVQSLTDLKDALDLLTQTGTVTSSTGGPVTFANQADFDSKMDAIKKNLNDVII